MHKFPSSLEPAIFPIPLIGISIAPSVLSIPIHDIIPHLSEIVGFIGEVASPLPMFPISVPISLIFTENPSILIEEHLYSHSMSHSFIQICRQKWLLLFFLLIVRWFFGWLFRSFNFCKLFLFLLLPNGFLLLR